MKKLTLIRKEGLYLKKKWKVLMGLCMVAGVILGGVGSYAQAANSFDYTFGYAGCTAYQDHGTAYTVARSGYASCGSVSLTFRYLIQNQWKNNGDGAGGVHGAGVEVGCLPGDNPEKVLYSRTEAIHIITLSNGGSHSEPTEHSWAQPN